jgi:hypothetical protein
MTARPHTRAENSRTNDDLLEWLTQPGIAVSAISVGDRGQQPYQGVAIRRNTSPPLTSASTVDGNLRAELIGVLQTPDAYLYGLVRATGCTDYGVSSDVFLTLFKDGGRPPIIAGAIRADRYGALTIASLQNAQAENSWLTGLALLTNEGYDEMGVAIVHRGVGAASIYGVTNPDNPLPSFTPGHGIWCPNETEIRNRLSAE